MAGIRGGSNRTEAGNNGGPSQADAGPYLSPWALCGCCGGVVIPALTPPLGSPAWLWTVTPCNVCWWGGHDPRTSHSPVQDDKGPRVPLGLRSVLHGPRAGLSPHGPQRPPTHPNAPRLFPASTPQPSPLCFLGPPPR